MGQPPCICITTIDKYNLRRDDCPQYKRHTLSVENVNDHLERIAIVREHLNAKGDSRKIVGAVAGGIVQENVLRYAQKKGLYVVVQSGEASTIANMPQDFKAREWVFS